MYSYFIYRLLLAKLLETNRLEVITNDHIFLIETGERFDACYYSVQYLSWDAILLLSLEENWWRSLHIYLLYVSVSELVWWESDEICFCIV